MISDKDKVIYSLEESINELEKAINNCICNKNYDSKNIYYRLGTTLLWIGSCLDRLRKSEKIKDCDQIENSYIQAFRGAYDAQKHSILLAGFQTFKTGGISFPMRFPIKMESPNYYFNKIDEDVIDNKKEIRKYNKILSNKPVLTEVKKIKQIIVSKFEN